MPDLLNDFWNKNTAMDKASEAIWYHEHSLLLSESLSQSFLM